jgi:hypothetical protein
MEDLEMKYLNALMQAAPVKKWINFHLL